MKSNGKLDKETIEELILGAKGGNRGNLFTSSESVLNENFINSPNSPLFSPTSSLSPNPLTKNSFLSKSNDFNPSLSLLSSTSSNPKLQEGEREGEREEPKNDSLSFQLEEENNLNPLISKKLEFGENSPIHSDSPSLSQENTGNGETVSVESNDQLNSRKSVSFTKDQSSSSIPSTPSTTEEQKKKSIVRKLFLRFPQYR